jgi:hypothetical protein
VRIAAIQASELRVLRFTCTSGLKVSRLGGAVTPEDHTDDYLRQPCRQVWAWLSHEAWQGAPSVVGHTRLQESFWLAQLAKQASLAASANRSLPIETLS